MNNLGWDDFFESKKAELELSDFSIARVVAEHKGAYRVKNEKGEFLAKVTGRKIFHAKSREDYPAVGDWVAIKEVDENQAVIQTVLPRKSVLRRTFGDKSRTGEKNDIQIIAANIDVAFIVQSVGRDYNINRFERYFVIAKNAGIKPVMILNKVDLISTEELDLKLLEIKNRLNDVEVVLTSAVNGEGLEKLKGFIERGKTYCFLGSSGVGKSSLINEILEKKSIKTDAIGAHSGRGKHTTTSREMYFSENGSIIIDNPGIREVGMVDAKEGIEDIFEDMETIAGKCKYADCTHVHEPGCEILAALKDGRLDEDRYSNYINMRNENEYLEMNKVEKREKNRQFGKFIKNVKKDLKKSGRKYF